MNERQGPRVIHVEGIPGAGKTTAARRLCQGLAERGFDVFWALEESADHPVMPKARRSFIGASDFPALCLGAWREFVSTNERVAVLDGYAFQSTVRFMYASGLSRDVITNYFYAWQAIGNSALVFLHVEAVVEHYERVLDERGEDWTSKLFAYVAATPIAERHGWSGLAGFLAFWTRYQDVCLDLVAAAKVPTTTVASRTFEYSTLMDGVDRFASDRVTH